METEPVRNEQEQIDFLREQIKQRPINKQKLFRRTLITVILAVVFGLVACLAFILFLPVINNRMYPEEPPETVSFPEEPNEMQPEEMVALQAEIETDVTAQAVAESLQSDVFEQLMRSYELQTSDIDRFYATLKGVAEEALKSTVTVTATSTGSDWFNDPYIRSGSVTGLIVADNGQETLILSESAPLRRAQNLTVTFPDGSFFPAEMKMQDTGSGLCVLAVANSALTVPAKESFAIAELGSSAYTAVAGTPVIAIGAPNGVRGSVCYGALTSDSAAIDLADSAFKLLTTDIYASEAASGVLIDLRGRVIGWIAMGYNAQGAKNLLCAIGITELKPLITRIGNGEERAYLGVHGASVPPEIKASEEIPDGAYITSIEMDSPAMQVGIQSGDIITRADETAFADYNALCSLLFNKSPGDTLRLTVLRQSGSTYREMELPVTLSGTGAAQ